ncbi:MAG: peptide-methionine (R)-S-oxide reductase MsrB [Phormidesmis sp.]
MKKRYFLQTGAAFVGAIALSRYLIVQSSAQNASKASSVPANADAKFAVTKTEAEWRKVLTAQQFNVLRKHDTERPFSSPLNKQSAPGTYYCAGCDLPLFASETKFESGTGWPSFYTPLENAIGTSIDRSLLIPRTEVHCRRCGGHLGHVFDDGPEPTGKRYCMNGAALTFAAS